MSSDGGSELPPPPVRRASQLGCLRERDAQLVPVEDSLEVGIACVPAEGELEVDQVGGRLGDELRPANNLLRRKQALTLARQIRERVVQLGARGRRGGSRGSGEICGHAGDGRRNSGGV
jgi:hypothetical protein